MDYVFESHKQAQTILESPKYFPLFSEVLESISEITDKEIIETFEAGKPAKGLAHTLNKLLKRELTSRNWNAESPIFQSAEYSTHKIWRLDFAKDTISIEVSFNHGEAIAWNLLKPVMASGRNHIQKQIETEIGIVICATNELKKAGNFDDATGEFEKICRYLVPLEAALPCPLLIIGLKAPKSFEVVGQKVGQKNIGQVRRFENL